MIVKLCGVDEMTANKRRVIFLTREKGESKEDFEARVKEVIDDPINEGYLLVETEEKGNGVILTFEA